MNPKTLLFIIIFYIIAATRQQMAAYTSVLVQDGDLWCGETSSPLPGRLSESALDCRQSHFISVASKTCRVERSQRLRALNI